MRGRLAGAALAAALVWTGAAEAATFKVTRTNDPPPGNCKPRDCSLREAVLAANVSPGKDVIVLPNRNKAYKLQQPGASEDAGLTGDLDINNHPLVIRHPGKGKARIHAVAADRVLHIQAGAPTALGKIAVTGGNSGGSDGGGILTDANLKLVRSVVAGNTGDDGSAIDLDSNASLALLRSAVRGNHAIDDADSNGAINSATSGSVVRIIGSRVVGNESLGRGGGVEIGGADALIKKSTIANNSSHDNGGGLGSASVDSTIAIVSSTIAGNKVKSGGGGGGGGVYLDGPTARITNSTVANNRALASGGGIQTSGVTTELRLNAVTVARNVADPAAAMGGVQGGGLYNEDSMSFDVRNSLIGLNRDGNERNDCEGNLFNSQGSNLLSTAFECDGFNQPSDLVRNNPRIAKLRNYGGPTATIGLRKGSSAVGNAHGPSAPNRDQRGRKRDANPDIGAFERGA